MAGDIVKFIFFHEEGNEAEDRPELGLGINFPKTLGNLHQVDKVQACSNAICKGLEHFQIVGSHFTDRGARAKNGGGISNTTWSRK